MTNITFMVASQAGACTFDLPLFSFVFLLFIAHQAGFSSHHYLSRTPLGAYVLIRSTESGSCIVKAVETPLDTYRCQQRRPTVLSHLADPDIRFTFPFPGDNKTARRMQRVYKAACEATWKGV